MKQNPFAHGLKAPYPIVENQQFLVKLVDNRSELEEVCRLRYEVFNKELDMGIESACENKLDYDRYDDFNAHLIVIDKKSKKIIATYRMQNYAMTQKGPGFCSADRFIFSEFPLNAQKQGLEVARACVHKSYRNTKVFFLLWKGLATVLYENKLRYFFGCSHAGDHRKPEVVKAVIQKLQKMNVHHKSINIKPLPNFRYEWDNNVCPDKKASIPSLLNLYLRFKCLICSDPCLNWRFREIEFMVIYDAHCVSDKYHRMFLDNKPRIF